MFYWRLRGIVRLVNGGTVFVFRCIYHGSGQVSWIHLGLVVKNTK